MARMEKVLVLAFLAISGIAADLLNQGCNLVEYGRGEMVFSGYERVSNRDECSRRCTSNSQCMAYEYDDIYFKCRTQTFKADKDLVLYRCQELGGPSGGVGNINGGCSSSAQKYGSGVIETGGWENVYDLNSCISKCKYQSTNCLAFEYNENRRTCRIHDFKYYSGVALYERQCSSSNLENPKCAMELYGKKGFVDFTDWKQAFDEYQCSDECTRNAKCLAYDYDYSYDKCRIQTFFDRDSVQLYRCSAFGESNGGCGLVRYGEGLIQTGDWYKRYSLNECADDCSRQACVTFEYDSDHDLCRIHYFKEAKDYILKERNCADSGGSEPIKECSLKEYGNGLTYISGWMTNYNDMNTCASLCSETASCDAYEYNQIQNMCRIFTYEENPEIVQYRRQCTGTGSIGQDCNLVSYGQGTTELDAWNKNYNLNSCFDKCSRTNNCDGFEYYAQYSACRLHLFKDDHYITQFRRECAEAQAITGCPLTEYGSYESKGGDRYFKDAEYKCFDLCNQDNACLAMTYYSQFRECTIHKNKDDLKTTWKNDNIIQYRRDCLA